MLRAEVTGTENQWDLLMTDDVYKTLLTLARRLVKFDNPSLRDQAEDLLNETLLRLIASPSMFSFSNSTHFQAVVSVAMRHTLIDQVRSAKSFKRGREFVHVWLDGELISTSDAEPGAIAVRQLIQRLYSRKRRPAIVLEMRAMNLSSFEEIADELSVSVRTVKRDYASARVWMTAELKTSRKAI